METRATFAKSVREIIESEEIDNYTVRFFRESGFRCVHLMVSKDQRYKVMNILLAQESQPSPGVARIEVQDGQEDMLMVIVADL